MVRNNLPSSVRIEGITCFAIFDILTTNTIEVLNGGHVAYQEQYNIIPMGQNFHSNAKHFHCSWHATWPPCKTSIKQISRLNFDKE